MRIHGEIASRGFLDKDDNTIGNALIDMYAKCGMLANAAAVMAGLPIRDRACWNAMIGGYAQQGRGREALECYREMQQQGKISPDEITFLALLSAFNHSGLINEARILYQNTMETRDLVPHAAELCTCMATVLGYAGRFEQAMSIIRSTSSRCYIMAWLAVLGACQKWGNVELGKLAFDRAIELDRSCAPAYALMAQVLASAHMQSNEDRSKQRMQRDKEIVSGSRKNIGAESHRN
jgi:pentatricopeptide repeat protein